MDRHIKSAPVNLTASGLLAQFNERYDQIAHELLRQGEESYVMKEWGRLDDIAIVALDLNLMQPENTKAIAPLMDIYLYLGLLADNRHEWKKGKLPAELQAYRDTIFSK